MRVEDFLHFFLNRLVSGHDHPGSIFNPIGRPIVLLLKFSYHLFRNLYLPGASRGIHAIPKSRESVGGIMTRPSVQQPTGVPTIHSAPPSLLPRLNLPAPLPTPP